MPPEPGSNIGPYVIERELGRGGMGVVFRGRDTRLDRAVAIKSLPDEVATDPERLARFEREAKTLAQVSHPNIAGIFGVERDDSGRYLVLEFVEGETLEAMIDRGALAPDEAIELASQIAAGVAAAHDAGVIHRDLKPANVMVTPEGHAKVLDFGLARSDDPNASSTGMTDAATLTTPAIHSPTIPGAIMGTAAYMSPEQARGRRVDKRTDVWSFGVVLYEMLTGRAPFRGETVSDSIGAILHMDLDLGALPAGAEAARHVIARCTQRDKDKRYRDLGDARLDLLSGAPTRVKEPAQTPRRSAVPLVAAAAVIAAAVAGGAVWLAKGEPERETLFFSVPAGLIEKGGGPTQALRHALSPEGDTLYYIGPAPGAADGDVGNTVVYRRGFDEFEASPISGTERAGRVAVSPDGRSLLIGWYPTDGRDYEIRRVASDGGPAVSLLEDRSRFDFFYTPVWLSDDRYVLMGDEYKTLYVASAAGGEPVAELDMGDVVDGYTFTFDCWSPSDSELLYVSGVRAGSAEGMTGGCWEVDFEAGSARLIAPNIGGLRVIDGTIALFWNDAGATLNVAEWDPDARSIVGRYIPIATGLGGDSTWTLTESGVLAYTESELAATSRIMTVAGGEAEPLLSVRREFESQIRVSPNGDSAAVIVMTRQGPRVHVVDLASGTLQPAARAEEFSLNPTWTPDGRLVYSSFRSIDEQTLIVVDDTRDPLSGRPLLPGYEGGLSTPVTFDPDVTTAIFARPDEVTVDGDLVAVDLDDGTVTDLLATDAKEEFPSLSPDGRWLAYRTQTGMDSRVEVRRYDAERVELVGRPVLVDRPTAFAPFWSRDGRTLFWREWPSDSMLAADVTSEAGSDDISFGPSRVAVDQDETPFLEGFGDRPVDELPDGEGFVFIEPRESADEPPYINVILNWDKALRERLADQ